MTDSKKIIGILGGIGSGKSTVSKIFADNGCAVIDADRIAHYCLDVDPVKSQLIDRFGTNILDENSIDRQKLADLVFDSQENLDIVNSIIHPKVLKKIDKLIDSFSRDNNIRAIVLDVPLLAEVGWTDRCNCLIFVDCDPHIRLQRAQNRGLSAEDLKKREKFQISLDIKSDLAHYTIHNNSDLGITIDQVIRVLSTIVE